jgi:hypothetical protein
MVCWFLSDTRQSTWIFDLDSSGPGGRRFKSSLPDQFKTKPLARDSYRGEILSQGVNQREHFRAFFSFATFFPLILASPQGLCFSKISKCLSGWGLYFFHNSRRRSFLSRHSLQLCPQSSVRVLPLSSRTWLCATKSACFRGPQESARN